LNRPDPSWVRAILVPDGATSRGRVTPLCLARRRCGVIYAMINVMGTDVLARIARELVSVLQRDVKTDWRIRNDVRAQLRSSIKRLLMKYRYPLDQQVAAIRQVLEQMEQLAPA
jgi:hypothetical protein